MKNSIKIRSASRSLRVALLFCVLGVGAHWYGVPLLAQTITTTTVASGNGDQGQYTSMAIANGNPAISFYDVSSGDLKYVRATDAGGTTWGTPVTLDSSGTVGLFTSLTIVNGNPAISYFDSTLGDLKYIRATDASGTTWGTPVTVDSSGAVGQYTSMAIVNGNPAISYYDASSGDLNYVRATDASGTTWGTPVTVDSSGTVGQYTSLAVVNGNPAISYHEDGIDDLKYVRATDSSGTTWGTPVTVDSIGGQYTSLAIVNGNPAISYYEGGIGDLKYVRATDSSGTTWGTPVVAAASSGSGQTTIVVVNGNPAISYYDVGGLNYVRATDASGTAWGTPVAADGELSEGQYAALAIVNGNPAISYYDSDGGELRYVRATDASGTTWDSPVTLTGGGSVGEYTSLAIVNGNPAISYFNRGSEDLNYVRATDADGTTWGTPVTLDSSGSVGLFTSLTIVNGNPAISYSGNGLRYVRATDASGTTWGTPVTVSLPGSTYTSLAIVNGNPAISYFSGSLKYVRATDADGTTWGTPVTLDSSGSVGLFTSLTIVNGNPAISYYDHSNGDLKYVRATDASGTTWGTPVIVDSASGVGRYTSLAIVNGNPAISYYGGGNLKYVRATDASGTTWGTKVIVDSSGIAGEYTSLAIVNGNPAISYYENTSDDLKYIRATDASGTTWAPPKTLDSSGIVGRDTSMKMVNGKVGVSYRDDTFEGLKFATLSLAPEIGVEQPAGTPIAHGGSKSFGNVVVGATSNLTFTINNTGDADLTVLGITFGGGPDIAMFTETAFPAASVSGPGSTTFTVRFAPTSVGSKLIWMDIANNDANEGIYRVYLQGTGVLPPVTFGSAAASTDEGVTYVGLPIQLATPLDATVQVAIAGTATVGADYSMLTTTLVFSATGSTNASATFTLLQDQLVEGTETIVASFASLPSFLTAGANPTMTVNITDDEPSVRLSASPSSFGESNGVAAVTVSKNAPTGTSTVEIALGGTATAGADYLALGGPVHIRNPAKGGDADFMGYAVTMLGPDLVAASRTGSDLGASNAGSVELFDRKGNHLLTINNPEPAASDSFGTVLAAVGTNLLVGVPNDDASGTDSGRAYLFSPTGALISTILNPAPATGDKFGYSVSAVGTNLLIAAPYDDAGFTDSGTCYIFSPNGTLLQTLSNPSASASDYFGYQVSSVGTNALIGTPYDDNGATDAGRAYLMSPAGSVVATFNNPAAAASDNFGQTVAGVGTNALIGASSDDFGAAGAGSAYLFSPNGTLITTINNPSPASGENFGISVAAAGTNLLIGANGEDTGASDAGSAYLISPNGTVLATINNPAPGAGDEMAWATAASSEVLVIAIYGDDVASVIDSGSVRVFNHGGTLLATLTNPAPATGDYLGDYVAAVGTNLLIGATRDDTGANDAGRAYLMSPSGNLITSIVNPAPADSDYFGAAIAGVGTNLLIAAWKDDAGAVDSGSAYLFSPGGALITTFANPTPAADDRFGYAVSAVGTNIAIGAYRDDTVSANAGSVYVFSPGGTLLATIANPAPAANDGFGFALAGVGTNLLVGAWADDAGTTDAGTAYLFAPNGTLITTINNPAPAVGDYFGVSVAALGTNLLIGAYGDDAGATDAGIAYVFSPAGTLLATLTNPSPSSSDGFGLTVAGVGTNNALIGATESVSGGTTAGRAYMFSASGLLLATVTNPAPAAGDGFSRMLAGVGTSGFIIGTYGDDDPGTDSGSAWYYSLAQTGSKMMVQLEGATTSSVIQVIGLNDLVLDPTETVQFATANIAGGSTGTPSAVSLTINDDETQPWATNYFVNGAAYPTGNQLLDSELVSGLFNVGVTFYDLVGLSNNATTPSYDIRNTSLVQVVASRTFTSATFSDSGRVLSGSRTGQPSGIDPTQIELGTWTLLWTAFNSNGFSTAASGVLSNGTPMAFSVADDDTAPPGAGSFTGNGILLAGNQFFDTALATGLFVTVSVQDFESGVSTADDDGNPVTAALPSTWGLSRDGIGVAAGTFSANFTSGGARVSAGILSATVDAAFVQAPGFYTLAVTNWDADGDRFNDQSKSVGIGIFTVVSADSPPVIVDPGLLLGTNGSLMSFEVLSFHPAGTVPNSLSATGLPSGAVFSSTPVGTNRIGTFTWNPAGAANTYPIKFTATAGAYSTSLQTRIYVKAPAEPVNGQGVPVTQTNWSPPTVSGNLNGGTLAITGTTATGIGYELWASRGPVTPTMTWARVVSETTATGSFLDFVATDNGTDTYYQVAVGGLAPVINSNIVAILHPVAKPGYQLASPPLVGDRRFDGTFGTELGANLTGDNGGVNGPGDKVMIYETSGPNWRTLYLDAAKVWRESGGAASTYQLAQGQGFMLLRNQATPTTNVMGGRVGNTGSSSGAIVSGFNIVTVSEGRPMSVTTAFENTSGGTPAGDYDFALADELMIQNANGSWKRLVRLPDGTWLDTQTGTTANVILQPGQAYYYSRKGAAMNVQF